MIFPIGQYYNYILFQIIGISEIVYFITIGWFYFKIDSFFLY